MRMLRECCYSFVIMKVFLIFALALSKSALCASPICVADLEQAARGVDRLVGFVGEDGITQRDATRLYELMLKTGASPKRAKEAFTQGFHCLTSGCWWEAAQFYLETGKDPKEIVDLIRPIERRIHEAQIQGGAKRSDFRNFDNTEASINNPAAYKVAEVALKFGLTADQAATQYLKARKALSEQGQLGMNVAFEAAKLMAVYLQTQIPMDRLAQRTKELRELAPVPVPGTDFTMTLYVEDALELIALSHKYGTNVDIEAYAREYPKWAASKNTYVAPVARTFLDKLVREHIPLSHIDQVHRDMLNRLEELKRNGVNIGYNEMGVGTLIHAAMWTHMTGRELIDLVHDYGQSRAGAILSPEYPYQQPDWFNFLALLRAAAVSHGGTVP
jgi:hypothetical protein